MILNQDILNLLNKMETISLNEMASVSLMNRIDCKFLFNIFDLTKILEACYNDYKVVVIAGQKYSSYQTVYYDTNDLVLYNQHHSGKLNRYKIRKRTYLESDLSYLEIKFKDNKGRTTKNRIKLSKNGVDDLAEQFIKNETNIDPKSLKPSVQIDYNRITFVNKNYPERITIDLNLTLSKDGNTRTFSNLVIAEVKQEVMISTPFTELMKEYRIKEGGISKYCFGISNLVEDVKKNNFKENNQKIIKLNTQHGN